MTRPLMLTSLSKSFQVSNNAYKRCVKSPLGFRFLMLTDSSRLKGLTLYMLVSACMTRSGTLLSIAPLLSEL